MIVTTGNRLRSRVCTTEVIVIKAPPGDLDLTCGGAEMVPVDHDVEPAALAPDLSDGTLLGKRYVDATGTFELLCTKAGDGSLALAGAPFALKDSKPLPASD